jgi:hypothetical protein
MEISPPIQSGSSGPLAKECHRFLVAGPFKLTAWSWAGHFWPENILMSQKREEVPSPDTSVTDSCSAEDNRDPRTSLDTLFMRLKLSGNRSRPRSFAIDKEGN